jgi:hypothetical protein
MSAAPHIVACDSIFKISFEVKTITFGLGAKAQDVAGLIEKSTARFQVVSDNSVLCKFVIWSRIR